MAADRVETCRAEDLIAALARERAGGAAPVVAMDYDGVLCDPIEDDIYNLPPRDGEDAVLRRAAADLGVPTGGLDLPYRRVLVYHAAALRLGVDAPAGAYVRAARWCAAEGVPWFVLTARSSPAMLNRALAFLAAHGLAPVEVFAIGRVEKHLQLDYLRRAYRGRPLHYVDDSEGHLAEVAARAIPGLRLHCAARQAPPRRPDELYAQCYDVIRRAAGPG